jgi:hypothetical protein
LSDISWQRPVGRPTVLSSLVFEFVHFPSDLKRHGGCVSSRLLYEAQSHPRSPLWRHQSLAESLVFVVNVVNQF